MNTYDVARIVTMDELHRANLQVRGRAVEALRSLLRSRKLELKIWVTRMDLLELEGYDPAEEPTIFATLRAHMDELARLRTHIEALIAVIRDTDRALLAEADHLPRQ